MLLLESSGVQPSHSILCPPWWETRPLEAYFQNRESRKSLGARSRKYGGWVMTGMLFSAKNCCTTSDVWLGASSWCRNHTEKNFALTSLIFRSLGKIAWMDPWEMPLFQLHDGHFSIILNQLSHFFNQRNSGDFLTALRIKRKTKVLQLTAY